MKTVKEILDEIDLYIDSYAKQAEHAHASIHTSHAVVGLYSKRDAFKGLKNFILSEPVTPKDCNHEWSGTEWDYCVKCKYEKPVPGQACEHEWSRVHDINVCLKCKKREVIKTCDHDFEFVETGPYFKCTKCGAIK